MKIWQRFLLNIEGMKFGYKQAQIAAIENPGLSNEQLVQHTKILWANHLLETGREEWVPKQAIPLVKEYMAAQSQATFN